MIIVERAIGYTDFADKYKGCEVKILSASKTTYIRQGVLRKCGVVERVSGNNLGIRIDGLVNKASETGIYWFKENEIELLTKGEEDNMTGYKYIAVVNLLEDYNHKDYSFALYEAEAEKLRTVEDLVVVNPRGKNNRVLGKIKELIPVEEYKGTVTAQVVGVVDTSAYDARIAEEERLKEIAIKKAAIEKELEEEINKRKTLEFYEKMAQEYNDNPRLAELVKELKGLGA